jgi:Osmosensitive K+ channel histidine kinase
MKFWKRKPPKMLWLVCLMVALLGLLATLQYRWLGQVSRGERERMQASLRVGAAHFSQDFNREITRVFLSFQMDSEMLRDKDSGEFAARVEKWNTSSPYPRLVGDLYVLETDEAKQLRLSRFNPAEKKFATSEWPTEFASLRPRLESNFREHISNESESLTEISLEPVAPDVPALISPILAAPKVVITEDSKIQLTPKERVPYMPENSAFAGYVIIKLNLEAIKKELIPTLAQRYFSIGDGTEYQLSVINLRAPEKPIYQSAQMQPQGRTSAGDATARLMVIEPDQLDTLFFGMPHKLARSPEGSAIFKRRMPPEQVLMRTEEQSESGSTRARSVTVRVFNREAQDNKATLERIEPGGSWQLFIQHPAGSLEAAVANARRRSLVISFGILLLLACSVAIIVINTRRAERLAHRQMEFVSAVSHEFRTPLAVICSAGENLADGIIDAPQQIERYGELIRNEGRRLTEMVEQVLEFAGARSGRTILQKHPLEIGPLIEDALASCQPLNVGHEFVIEKEVQSDLPTVEGDAAALRRTLQNLLNNAMKYDREKRRISIRARSVVNSHGEEVQITVEDQGIGIEPAELPHIFEPFYRGSEVVAAQIHGNGLGLSLVKQVVEAHRGRVSVVSVPGQGSAFTLHLPGAEVVSDIKNLNHADKL